MRTKQTKTQKTDKEKRGELYRYYREKAGFVKQQDAVKKLKFKTPYQLSVYETGKADPPIDVLIKMSEVYGVSVDRLIKPQKKKKNSKTNGEILKMVTDYFNKLLNEKETDDK